MSSMSSPPSSKKKKNKAAASAAASPASSSMEDASEGGMSASASASASALASRPRRTRVKTETAEPTGAAISGRNGSHGSSSSSSSSSSASSGPVVVMDRAPISLDVCTDVLGQLEALVRVSELKHLQTLLAHLHQRHAVLSKMSIDVAMQAPRGKGKTTLADRISVSFKRLHEAGFPELWGHVPLHVTNTIETGTIYPATLQYSAASEAFDVVLRGEGKVVVPLWQRARVTFEAQLAKEHELNPPVRYMPQWIRNLLIHQYAAKHVDQLLEQEMGAGAYAAALASASAAHSSSVSKSSGASPIGKVVLTGKWAFGEMFRVTDTIGWESVETDELVLGADSLISLSDRCLQADELRTLFNHGAFNNVLQDSKKVPVLMHVARLPDVESADDKRKLSLMTRDAIDSLFRDLSVLPGLENWEARHLLFQALEQNLVSVAPSGMTNEEQEISINKAMRTMQSNYFRSHYINFVKESSSLLFWCKRRGEPASVHFMASRWQNQRSKFKKQVTQDSEFLRSSLRTSLLEWLDSVSDIESWFDSLRTPALLTPEGQWQLDTFQRRILQALDLTAKTLLQHSLQKLISRFILNSQQEKPTTSSAAAQGAGGGAASSARSSNNGPAPMDLDTDDATAAVADDLRLSKRAKTESAVAAAAAASSVARASAPSAAPASASTAAVESIAVKELNDEVRQFLELELQKPECVQPAIDIKNKFTAEIRSAVGQRRITAVLLEAIAAVNRQPTSQPALASNGSNSDLAASSFPLSLWSGAASSSSAAAAAHSSSASSSAAAAPASSPFWK